MAEKIMTEKAKNLKTNRHAPCREFNNVTDGIYAFRMVPARPDREGEAAELVVDGFDMSFCAGTKFETWCKARWGATPQQILGCALANLGTKAKYVKPTPGQDLAKCQAEAQKTLDMYKIDQKAAAFSQENKVIKSLGKAVMGVVSEAGLTQEETLAILRAHLAKKARK
jgi:hypothetical protein